MYQNFKIKGFLSTSLIDWPGKICSVVFLGGCGFKCPTCHNHQLVLKPESLPDYPIKEIMERLKSHRNWIDGVTVTGGEPTGVEDLPELLKLLRKTGLMIKLDTNGSNPVMLESLIGSHLVDAVYMDIKAPLTDAEYSAVAGVRVAVKRIHRSISLLNGSGLEIAYRTTAIPTLVEEPELQKIRDSLGDINRFIVQGFRGLKTLSAKFHSVMEFPLERLEAMRARFEVPAPAPAEPDQFAGVG